MLPAWHCALCVAIAGLLPSAALAQFRNGNQTILLNLPRVSPHAVITQRIGVTDVTIDYHRPRVDGRTIFGDVVWFDRVWRAGANDTTTIAFPHPVAVEGQPLPAGRYGLHMIPGKAEWTVIFSKNATSWGSFTYDPAEDALRVKVKPRDAACREELAYEFADLKEDGATILMSWERVAVPFRLTVDTRTLTLESLRRELRHLPGYKAEAWYEAAMFCVDHQFNYGEALRWIDRAIAEGEEGFDNLDLKAQILAGLGRVQEAETTQAKALALAGPEQMSLYGNRLLREKKVKEAQVFFTSVTQKHPDAWMPWYGLARVQVVLGDRAAAERSLREALKRATAAGHKQGIAGMRRMLERLAAGQGIG
jgi:hypothetical protein